MGKPWEDYKSQIHALYIEQNMPLKDVQFILKDQYGFDACKRAFQNQIEAWGFRKNVRSSEMQVYVQQKKLRKSDSEIDLPEDTMKIITPRKARRFEKRSESMNQHKAGSVELDPHATAHLQHLHSPSYNPHRSSVGPGYLGYSQYAHDPMAGSSSNFTQSSSGPSHDIPKYANGMIISLCDDANTGAFSLPVNENRSPYGQAPAYVNPVYATTAPIYEPLQPTHAPLYDLTTDNDFNNGMFGTPAGIVKRDMSNDWYMLESQFGEPQLPYNPTEPVVEELHGACWAGDYENVRLMLEKGASGNAFNSAGETPITTLVKGLSRASMAGGSVQTTNINSILFCYHRCLEILRQFGADTNMPNRRSQTPIQLVTHKRFMNPHAIFTEEGRNIFNSILNLLGGPQQMPYLQR